MQLCRDNGQQCLWSSISHLRFHSQRMLAIQHVSNDTCSYRCILSATPTTDLPLTSLATYTQPRRHVYTLTSQTQSSNWPQTRLQALSRMVGLDLDAPWKKICGTLAVKELSTMSPLFLMQNNAPAAATKISRTMPLFHGRIRMVSFVLLLPNISRKTAEPRRRRQISPPLHGTTRCRPL